MPFYQKFHEFSHVLPLNHQYLNHANMEVILALDEDSQADLVKNFVQQYPDIKWRIVVSSEKHAWRAPSKAINVGIKLARGKQILIVSPESVFVNNLPSHMLSFASLRPNSAICGRLNTCTFSEFFSCADSHEAMFRYRLKSGKQSIHYGSLLVDREKAIEIGGYDECLTKWGGDDDNFRARLALAGVHLLKTSDINIVHLDYSPKPSYVRKPQKELDILLNPKQKQCSRCYPTWGQAFDNITLDWDPRINN